jgi:hypothetical protein
VTYAETADHYHYVTVRHAGRVGFLAGPFRSRRDAELRVDAARREAEKIDPWAGFYAFGTSRVLTTAPRPGVLNERLGITP